MKIFGFLAFICVLGTALPTFAQEKVGFGTEENFKGQDELNPRMDTYSNTPLNSISSPAIVKESVRDTSSVKSNAALKPKTESTTNQKKSEDETLSLNLLYYIIQKFKVSEMVN